MIGLLICAAVAAVAGWVSAAAFGSILPEADEVQMWIWFPVSLALVAALADKGETQ